MYRLTFCSGEQKSIGRVQRQFLAQEGAERHPTTAPKPLTCGRSTARHGARAGHDAVHARLGITARGSNQRHPLAPHIMAAGGA